MRKSTLSAALCGIAGIAAVAVAQSPDRDFFGHFYRLPPKAVKDRAGHVRAVWPRVNDTADIARMPDGNAFVKLAPSLSEGACAWAGVARLEGRELVYRDLTMPADTACQVVFTTEAGRLTWRDNGKCVARCPAGLNGSLPLSHRVRAQPAARLPGYQAALAEWRQSLPGAM